MTSKFVDIEALNFRSVPDLSPSTRIGILHLGQPVQEQGAHDKEWVKIRADIDGVSMDGVVKSEIDGKPSLREPVSASREALVAEVIKEWLRFHKGLGMEYHDPFFKFVGEMWQAIGEKNLDGKDRDVPWSAAAISFMVRNAGKNIPKYKNFKFAASHSRYMHDSIIKQKKGDTDAPFWGFELHRNKPEIGDIVCKWRETPRDFDDAEASDSFKSHSDIIVSVSPDFVLAIGGNVDQSVSITRYEKTGAGFLAAKNAVFMHMVNQT